MEPKKIKFRRCKRLDYEVDYDISKLDYILKNSSFKVKSNVNSLPSIYEHKTHSKKNHQRVASSPKKKNNQNCLTDINEKNLKALFKSYGKNYKQST
jgi:hypothetical protein